MSEITAIKQTQSGQATSIERLGAKFDNLAVGGRNLLRNSNANYVGNRYLTTFALAQVPDVSEQVTVTLWGDLGADRTKFVIYNTHGFRPLAELVKVSDGIYRATFAWNNPLLYSEERDNSLSSTLNVYAFTNTATSDNRIDRIKLERGNIATDWTPAPEDIQNEIDTKASSASLDEFKQASANADNALSQRISTLNAQYTKADTDLTARLAREETARARGRKTRHTCTAMPLILFVLPLAIQGRW